MNQPHTEITERDGISAVRRHLRDEHGLDLVTASAAAARSIHTRQHELGFGPQNPPMPDPPEKDWLTALVLEQSGITLADPHGRFDAEAAYVRWAEANPGEATDDAYNTYESRRDREG